MKCPFYIAFMMLLICSHFSCSELRVKKEIVYDTIATDTALAVADRSIYGKIGMGSTMKELNLMRTHDSILFDLSDCRILGRYIVGDSVAVVASGNEKASKVIDLTSLDGEWVSRETDTIQAEIKFLANKRLEMHGLLHFSYDNWAIMNGDIIFSKQIDNGGSYSDTTVIFVLDKLDDATILFHNSTDTFQFKRDNISSIPKHQSRRKRK